MNVQMLGIIKGGTGKSTIAVNMGSLYPYLNKRTLMIDCDPQGNTSSNLRVSGENGSILDILTGLKTFDEVIIKEKKLHIIPSSPELTNADKLLDKIGKEYLLKEKLKDIENEYDEIFIDTPPAASILTINSMVACNNLIIPSQADYFSIQGISQIYSCYESIKKYCKTDIKIAGILITRFNKRTVISNEMVKTIDELAQQYGTKVFSSKIRESIVVKEAQANKMNLFEYAPKSDVTKDLIEFIKEYRGDLNG